MKIFGCIIFSNRKNRELVWHGACDEN